MLMEAFVSDVPDDNSTALITPIARRTGRGGRLLAALSPLIVVAVFAAGYAWRIGWPAWPVTDASERIAYAAIAAAPLAMVVAMVRPLLVRVVLNLIAVAICSLPAMWPQYQNEVWTGGVLSMWAIGVAVSVAVAASVLQWLDDREAHSPLVPLVTLGMSAAGGALLMSTGSLKLGQAGFSLAAGVAIMFVISLFVRPLRDSAGLVTLALAILGGLFMSGHLWSELPLYAAVCVLVAPMLATIVRVPILARRPVWQRVVIGVVLAAMPATAVAIPLAMKAQKASESAEDYGY